MKRPPSVIWPAMICRAPTYITAAPTTPSSTAVMRLRSDVVVSVVRTLARMRSTPFENTSASRASAW